MFNLGKMKIAAIKLYNAFIERCSAQTEEDHRRYLSLMDFLGAPAQETPAQPKHAAADDVETQREELRRERKKTEQFVGDHGMNQAFSQAFKNLIEDYLPGGYFWDEDAKKVVSEFYRMVYKGFRDHLPRMISEKLRDEKITGVAVSDIKFDPETINKVATDALIYFSENPEEIKDGLIRAFSKKSKDEESRMGVGQAFFVPKIDDSTYAEMLRDPDKAEDSPEVRPGDVDLAVLKNLEDRDTLAWKWKGVDENGMLHFTLPELYGKREFTMKLPPDVKNIRPGDYTFKVKEIGKRGAVVEFVEQRDAIHKDTLNSIETAGLGVDQLKSFIDNGIVSKYRTVLRRKPIEALLEDFGGKVTIGGEQIGSVEDLAELGTGDLETSGARGKEKIEEARRKKLEEEQSKIKAVIEKWGPVLGKHFLQVRPNEGAQMAQAIAAQFPERSTKKVPSLPAVLATRPVVQLILNAIMSPATPSARGGKASPWVSIVKSQFDRAALENPVLKEQLSILIKNQKAKQTKTLEDPAQQYAPVSDAEIRQYVKSIPNNLWSARIMELRDEIKDVMQSKMQQEPALKKFFERRRVFENYIRKDLEDQVETIMEEQKLDPTNAEDMKTLDKFMQKFIDSTVKKMESPASMAAEASENSVISKLMKQAYRIANSKR